MKKLLLNLLLLLMVSIGAVAQDDVTIGELSGTSSTYLPAYSLYEYSLTQQIYTSDEIGMAGTINSLSLWLKNTSSYARNLNVYMKEVDKSSFASGSDWESISSSDMVATATIANGVDNLQEVVFTLETPFQYSGADNLLICIADVTGSWSGGLAGATASCSGNMAIYAYRDGSAYNTENPSASGSTTTDRNVVKLNITPGAAPSCSKVNNLVADNLTSSSADITWEAGGTETNWVLKYGPTGFDVETAGTTENVSGTPDFQITGLTGNTAYSVYVKAVCGEGDESGWKNVSFRTECGMQTIPYTETFEDVTGSYAIPDCWERIIEYTSSSATYPYVATNSYYTTYSHAGDKALYVYTSSYNSAYENLIALPIMNGVNSLQISLWAKSNNSTLPEAFEIGYIKSGVFTSVKSITLSTSYQQYMAYLNEAPADAERIAIRAYHSSSSIAVFVDDIEVSEMPTCIAPENLHVSNITTNSASVVWTDILPATAWQYQLNDGDIENVDAKPINLTELTPNTEYTIKVRTVCGDSEFSDWTEGSFTTLCNAITIVAENPYTEDFESYTGTTYDVNGVAPDCWKTTSTGSVAPHIIGTGSYYYVHGGDNALTFYGTGYCYAVLPTFTNDLTTLCVEFWSRMESTYYGTLVLGYITADDDNMNTFTEIETYTSSSVMTSHRTLLGTVPAEATRLVFRWYYSGQYSCCIDDVVVRLASTEAEILTYSLPTQASDATIGDGTIEVTVANSTDFDVDLTPTYTISENAEISDPVITGEGDVRTIAYTVTAEAGNTKDWTVTVTKAPISHDAFITAFTFAGQKEGTTAEIVSENDTYTVDAVAEWNADLTTIAPTVTISAGAQVTPASGAEQDFTAPVTYTVLAEDGETSHTYTVTIVNDPDACINPATVNVTELTATTATLGWEQAYTETSYLVKVSTEAMTDMTATANVFDGTVEATTKELEGLTGNTQYFVYVQSDCENAEGWTLSSFTTACDAIVEFPWTENFDSYDGGNFTASCWTNEHIAGGGSNIFNIYTSSTGSNSTHQLQLPDMTSGTLTKLVLPVMNIPTEGAYIFGLDVYRNNSYSSKTDEGIRVYASANGEIEGATELAFVPRVYSATGNSVPAESATGWYSYKFNIPLTGTCYIILRGESKYGASTYMDNFVVRALSTEAEIVDFNFPTRMSAPVIRSDAGTITTTASYQADLENLDETVTVSEAAEYVENTATVEGNVKTFTYTVTAEDGTTTKDWTVTVTKAESASTANDIVAFSFVGQVGESVIDPEAKTVTAYAEWDFDFENNTIAPTIEVSPMATINPASGVAQNFNAPVQYAVTAEDGESVANWTVTITNDPNACVNPAEVNVVSVTETTAALSWDKMYLETSYLVKVSTEPMDDMTAEADVYDDEVELEGDAAALALTGLTPATIYYVYVQSNCGAEDWTISYFATECDGSAYPVPFVETFETGSALCWTVIDANNDAEDWGGIYGGAWNIGDLIGDGNIIGGYVYSSDNDANDWLISPKIAIVDGAYLTFDYAGYSSYYTEKFSVYVMDDPANYASATQILTTQIVETADYASIANIDLSAYADQEIYIGIKCESEADQDALFIDNFKVVLPVYTITATAGENGTIDPASAEVIYGSDQAFTITPAEGYRIESVVVDAETENEDDVTEEELVAGDGVFFYTFENVTANHTINVTFEEIPTYTITVDAGENGTVLYNDALVSEPITVNEGATPEFVITPATGYQIEALTVGGETVELTAEQLGGYTYTFEPVMADVTLVVTFEAIPVTTYTITLTVGEHGTVTYNGEEVEGEVTVEEGATPAFVITPAENYQIDVLTVGGVTVAVADANLLGFTYIFEAVTANTSLSVTFVEVGSAEMLEAGSMAIYPNPNNGMFSIDFSNIEGDATYQLINANGAVVETRDINVMSGETMNFNHNLRPGAYFVRIINGDKVYVEQIVVE